jgi:hypothetical protein
VRRQKFLELFLPKFWRKLQKKLGQKQNFNDFLT